MTFERGQSGNPTGRPPGTKDKRTALRELLEPHAPALIEKAVSLALEGDITAIKICLDRLIPALKSIQVNSANGDTLEQCLIRLSWQESEKQNEAL